MESKRLFDEYPEDVCRQSGISLESIYSAAWLVVPSLALVSNQKDEVRLDRISSAVKVMNDLQTFTHSASRH